jgi:hypothetical protein
MFCYPSTLPIHAGDNMVLDGHGSLPTMNSDAGIGTREQILLVEILRHCESILLKLSMCSSVSKVVGGGARCAIGEPGGDGGADVLGAVADNALIVRNSDTKGIDDDVLATDDGGGDPLGSIDDGAAQLAVTGNDDSSAVRRVSTSMRIVAAHHSRIGIGPGRHRKPWGGSTSLARALAEFTAEGDVAIGVCVSDCIAVSGLSTDGIDLGTGGTIGVMHNDDGGDARGAGSSVGSTMSDNCSDISGCCEGSGALMLDPIGMENPTSCAIKTFGNLDQQGGPVMYVTYQVGPAITSPHCVTTQFGSYRHLTGGLGVDGAFLDACPRHRRARPGRWRCGWPQWGQPWRRQRLGCARPRQWWPRQQRLGQSELGRGSPGVDGGPTTAISFPCDATSPEPGSNLGPAEGLGGGGEDLEAHDPHGDEGGGLDPSVFDGTLGVGGRDTD